MFGLGLWADLAGLFFHFVFLDEEKRLLLHRGDGLGMLHNLVKTGQVLMEKNTA